MITVVCWKWNNGLHPKKKLLFTAEHVNKLQAAISRHTALSHEFVCVTDDWKGLHSSVGVVNIDRHFGDFKDWGGCYRRLKSFDQATALALFGPRFISIDLDVLVVGDLDPILGFKEDFRMWKDKHRRRTPFCGSLWGMRAGARQEVWDKFSTDPHMSVELMRRLKFIGTDQAHISAQLFDRHEATWEVEDGIYNFNTRIRRQFLLLPTHNGKQITPKRIDGSLPGDARLVFFNGRYDPSQTVLQRDYPWIRDHWNG
jgi:hypothetical protein